MNRLTIKLKDKSVVYDAKGFTCDEVCVRYLDEAGCNTCPTGKAFNKLAAYEDTGLEPEQVQKWVDNKNKIKQQIAEMLEKKYEIPQDDEGDTCEQYCSDCPHRICGIKTKQETKNG